jgi:hypothetical protein
MKYQILKNQTENCKLVQAESHPKTEVAVTVRGRVRVAISSAAVDRIEVPGTTTHHARIIV